MIQQPVIAGNWKMNIDPARASVLVTEFLAAYPSRADRTVLLCPPAISFTEARRAATERPDVHFGVQNLHWEPDGAFTGETSARMAHAAGARFALAGHSERRHVFGESDADVARKARAALDAGLTPVVCVGETIDERRAGRLEEVILRQLGAVLAEIAKSDVARILVAYEPVWAIGTGVVATPGDAHAAHAVLRARLSDEIGDDAAAIPILYGGSVKPDNAAQLLGTPEIGGLLVGGASLDAKGFAAIANAPVGA